MSEATTAILCCLSSKPVEQPEEEVRPWRETRDDQQQHDFRGLLQKPNTNRHESPEIEHDPTQSDFRGLLHKSPAGYGIQEEDDEEPEQSDFRGLLKKSKKPTKDKSDASEVSKVAAEQKDFRSLLSKSGTPTKDGSDASKHRFQKAEQKDFRQVLSKTSGPTKDMSDANVHSSRKADQKDYREVLKSSSTPTKDASDASAHVKDKAEQQDLRSVLSPEKVQEKEDDYPKETPPQSPKLLPSEDQRSRSLDDLSETAAVETKTPSVKERRTSQPARTFTEADLHDLQVCMFVPLHLFLSFRFNCKQLFKLLSFGNC